MRRLTDALEPCPGGCNINTPRGMACVRCWRDLPETYRMLVLRTYEARNLFPRDHAQALDDARRWWLEHPLPTRRGVLDGR